jgi:OOP family OmpA-OmpF porin
MLHIIPAQKFASFILGGVLLASATSCVATRKHVRNTVEPINTKVAALETKTTQQAGQIDNLERGVGRLDETIKTVDAKAIAAGRDAKAAQDAANAADAKGVAAQSSATEAQNMVRTTDGKVSEAGKRITALEGNYDYKMLETETVLFARDKDGLDEEAKTALAAVAGKVGNLKRYAVEVQGYTDSTGDPSYNLALSSRRANAVVRYLTTEVKVPLYRIAVIGAGEITPEKGVKETREARQANRKVEVKLYSAD